MFGKRQFKWAIWIIAAILVAACSAPAGSTSSGQGAQTYIARLEGAPGSARAVIVVENGKFDAYVCSLDDAFNLTSARWYKGELDANGNFQAVSSDGVEFKGTVSGDQLTGTLVNTEKVSMPFSGARVPQGGKAGLYRGLGQYGGEDVIVGAVMDVDGTFASTAQYKGRFEFVNPVAATPVELGSNSLGVQIGPDATQVTTNLVTTLEGPSIFQ
jgi:hypothetical protein